MVGSEVIRGYRLVVILYSIYKAMKATRPTRPNARPTFFVFVLAELTTGAVVAVEEGNADVVKVDAVAVAVAVAKVEVTTVGGVVGNVIVERLEDVNPCTAVLASERTLLTRLFANDPTVLAAPAISDDREHWKSAH